MIESYSQINTLGHRYVQNITNGRFIVEEKVDGSQFSFCRRRDGTVEFRSKGAVVYPEDAGMFQKACLAVLRVRDQLNFDWIYRGEYLQKPKHNVLAYDRIPRNHIAIFDIEMEPGVFMCPANKYTEANLLGFDCVPYFGGGTTPETAVSIIDESMQQTSFLGGQKVEGVVIKNYDQFGPDKKFMIAKVVSAQFKEIHRHEWKQENPSKSDIVAMLVAGLRTPARWNKSIQHLREAGVLLDAPQDIGLLLKEIKTDIEREAADEIKERLFKHFWPQISRGVTMGFPEYYKGKLNEQYKPVGRQCSDAAGSCDGAADQPQEQTHKSCAEALPSVACDVSHIDTGAEAAHHPSSCQSPSCNTDAACEVAAPGDSNRAEATQPSGDHASVCGCAAIEN